MTGMYAELSSNEDVTLIIGDTRIFIRAASPGCAEIYMSGFDNRKDEWKLVVRHGQPKGPVEPVSTRKGSTGR